MKGLITILAVITTVLSSCSNAQVVYSSKDKKAIELIEKAQKIGKSNFAEAISYCEKALERDPNFWEAHLLAGEFSEYTRENKNAINHYREAIKINPQHSRTGSTYYYLGMLEYKENEFDNAIKTLTTYSQNKSANPQYVKDANQMIEMANLALEEQKNPSNFNPINLGAGVNTADPEYFPTITVDGKTILFTRLIHDDRVPAPEEQYKKQEDFFVSNLNEYNIWQKAFPMPTNINTLRNEGAPTISADGRSLIFVACSMGDVIDYGEGRTGKGSCDLFITKRLGQQWSNPVNLPGLINTGSWESQPSLSSDGKTMYFVRRVSSRGMESDADIFVSYLQPNGTWGAPIRLPNTINTPLMEESVLIHPDGKTLYFASRGHKGFGGLDIYVSRMDASGNWSQGENLGYPINTQADENSLMVSADGEIAFFASDRAGGFGDLDLYYFMMPDKFKPVKTLYFDGLVYDQTNPTKKLAGKFSLIDIKTGKEIISSEADPVTGAFTVSLPLDCEYILNVSYPGYNFFSQNFNMTIPENQEVFHMDVPLVPITAPGIPVALKNVFFDLNLATLRPESTIELTKLRDFLKANPDIKIELAGHTDTQGDAAVNLKLSEARAKSVLDFLVTNGIAATRLSSKGFGETKPIFSDEQIAKQTTEAAKQKMHQENRRTEYTVIK